MLNEVNWPEGYLPGTTDNFASNEIIVRGITAKEVFDNLIDTSVRLPRRRYFELPPTYNRGLFYIVTYNLFIALLRPPTRSADR